MSGRNHSVTTNIFRSFELRKERMYLSFVGLITTQSHNN
jgi:hypothetical protein